MSHFRSGILLSSNIVPMVDVNCFLHATHWRNPARILFFPFGSIFQMSFWFLFLQCGQTAPLGQWMDSQYSRADSSPEIAFILGQRQSVRRHQCVLFHPRILTFQPFNLITTLTVLRYHFPLRSLRN